MPVPINLDKISEQELRSLDSFIWVQKFGKRNVILYSTEDAELIVKNLKEAKVDDPKLLDPEYWASYNDVCRARISLRKVLKRSKSGKYRKNYLFKYNLKKMLACPKNAGCAHSGERCLKVSRFLSVGYACGCRRSGSFDGSYQL